MHRTEQQKLEKKLIRGHHEGFPYRDLVIEQIYLAFYLLYLVKHKSTTLQFNITVATMKLAMFVYIFPNISYVCLSCQNQILKIFSDMI